MGTITGEKAKEVFLKAVDEGGTQPTKRKGCDKKWFGGVDVDLGDVLVFNNQWPHAAPVEEYPGETGKRNDAEWKSHVSEYGRRWVYVSWQNKTNKVNAIQEPVHINSVEHLFNKQYDQAAERDEAPPAKKAKHND